MEFHSLARKELQTLCKLNKIPANMTNVAMADALKSLEIVEGIEDFLNPSISVTAESTIESPERNVVTSPKAPLTGCRTSTRRKPVRQEAKNDVPKTPAVRSSRKRVPAVSVSRKMETQLKESTVENENQMDQEKEDFLETPAVVPNSRRKGVGVSTRRTNLRREEEVCTVQIVYSTRRSARLTDKKLAESFPMGKEITEAIKINSFSKDISENDLGEVSENTIMPGNDSQTVLQEGLEIPRDSEFLSVNKSDVASESVRIMKVDVQEETGDNYEVDDPKAKLEEKSETLDESNVVSEEHSNSLIIENDGDNKGIEINSETKSEVGNERSGTTEVLIDENLEKALLDMPNQILENKGDEAEADSDFLEQTICLNQLDGEKEPTISEIFNCNDSKENADKPEMDLIEGTEDNSSDNNSGDDVEADSDFLEHKICLKQLDVEKEPTISEILNCNDSKENADQSEMDSVDSSDNFSGALTSDNELDFEKSLTKESGLQVAIDLSVQKNLVIGMGANETEPTYEPPFSLDKTPASVKQSSPHCLSSAPPSLPALKTEDTGYVSASILVDDPLTIQFPSSLVDPGHIARPTRLTPVKKPSTKTPTIKRMIHVSDDKENIDHSGRKLELTKEKEKKNKKEIAVNNKHKAALEQESLRQLTKMLKQKLQISNNTIDENKEEKHIAKVRPALQTLSENCNHEKEI